MARSRKDRIVHEIAKDLYLREDVVADVLARFMDVAVEEIVNTGEFKLHQFLSVQSVDYKGYDSGKGYVEPHQRLRVKLSAGIGRLFQLKAKKFNHAQDAITRDNWRQVLAESSQPEYSKRSGSTPAVEEEFFNPLLDDDD